MTGQHHDDMFVSRDDTELRGEADFSEQVVEQVTKSVSQG